MDDGWNNEQGNLSGTKNTINFTSAFPREDDRGKHVIMRQSSLVMWHLKN